MKDIICKRCGTIYTGNEIPDSMQCICESTEFESRHNGIMDDAKAEEAVA